MAIAVTVLMQLNSYRRSCADVNLGQQIVTSLWEGGVMWSNSIIFSITVHTVSS